MLPQHSWGAKTIVGTHHFKDFALVVSLKGEVMGVLLQYVDSDEGRVFCATSVPSTAIR